MNKREFEKELLKELKSFPPEERQKILGFYDELFCDRKEQGEDEPTIIKSFGSAKEIAAKYSAEAETPAEQGGSVFTKAAGKTKSAIANLFTNKSFLIFYFSAFVITIPLTIAALSIILSLGITFAAIVISFFATGFALLIAGPVYFFYGLVFIGLTKPSGLALAGGGLAMFAVGLAFITMLMKILNYLRILVFVSGEKKHEAYKRARGKGILRGFIRPAVAVAIITVLGGTLFTIGLVKADFNIAKLDTRVLTPFTKTFNDSPINKLTILDVKSRDIDIVVATENYRIETNNYKGSTVSAAFNNGELVVKETYKFQFSEIFNIFDDLNYKACRIRIYVPAATEVEVKITSGDVKVTGLSPENIDINITSGDTLIIDCKASNIRIAASSGDITVKNCATANFVASASSGDIRTYSLRTLHTSMNVDLKTSSGDIHARIVGDIRDFVVTSFVTSGSNHVGTNAGNGSGNKINIRATSGDIRLTFEN